MKRPPLLDLAIAAALVFWAVMEAALLDGEGSTAQRIAWAIGFSAPLALRRQFPVAVCFTVAAVVAARVLVAEGGPQEEGAMPLPSLLLASFSAGVHARTVALAIAGGAAVVAAVGTAVSLSYYEGTAEPSDGAILGFFLLAAWGAGYFVRRRGTIAAQQAVLEERARIARELHDIIGHSVSVISLQAGAAEQLVARDPARAQTHLAAVRETAHQALVEMRRLMGVLKEDEAEYAPQPGLDNLDDLVAHSGLEVEVVREGDPRDIAPGVDLAAYRIVQEALTNARKHGAAKQATVKIGYRADGIEVEVTNPLGNGANGESGGQGLIGMKERARLFGGTLHAERGDTEFRVRATLPA